MSWRERAKEAISEACLTYMDITGITPSASMPEANKRELLRMVGKYYPFGQRKMHPYKIWCSEVKHLRSQLYRDNAPICTGLFATATTETEEGPSCG